MLPFYSLNYHESGLERELKRKSYFLEFEMKLSIWSIATCTLVFCSGTVWSLQNQGVKIESNHALQPNDHVGAGPAKDNAQVKVENHRNHHPKSTDAVSKKMLSKVLAAAAAAHPMSLAAAGKKMFARQFGDSDSGPESNGRGPPEPGPGPGPGPGRPPPPPGPGRPPPPPPGHVKPKPGQPGRHNNKHARSQQAENPHSDRPFFIIGVPLDQAHDSSHKHANIFEMNLPLVTSDDRYLTFRKSESPSGAPKDAGPKSQRPPPPLRFHIDSASGVLIEGSSKKCVGIADTDKVALTDQPSQAARTWNLSGPEGGALLSLNKDQRFYVCPHNDHEWALHFGVNDVCSNESQGIHLIAQQADRYQD